MDPSRRVALHAALGDPVRLAIVDELSTTDRSPSELAHRLGLPSNLLAHHLGVLVEVGLVQRFESSGDRRRRYVRLDHHLVREWAGHLVAPRTAGRRRVLFVCTHNSARSQLAAVLWRQRTGGHADSAGTHPADAVHPGAVAAAARAGIDLSAARPRHLDPGELSQSNGAFVVTVCDRAHEELGHAVTSWHWSIDDPVADGRDEAFDRALSEIDARIATLPLPADRTKETS